MLRFKDKIILVTGSRRGIGKATALCFAKEGGILIVHDAEETDELDETFSEVSGYSPSSIKITCELSDSDAIRFMFQKIEDHFHRLDILVK